MFFRSDISQSGSYDDVTNLNDEMELNTLGKTLISARSTSLENERVPVDGRNRRQSMKRLVRQASSVNTQKTTEGTMQMIYLF